MRVPLSWLREYAPGRRAGRRPRGRPAADRGRPGGGVGRAGRRRRQRRGGRRGPGDRGADRVQEADPVLPGRRRRRARHRSASVVCGAAQLRRRRQGRVALPGAVLPGGFEIGARKTYGRMSEGMICSAAELGIGDDHSGILVLPPDAPLGADFVELAGLADEVLDIAVTPDRGYCAVGARRGPRAGHRVRAALHRPGRLRPARRRRLGGGPDGRTRSIADPAACDRFVLREVHGLDPARRRRCGCRSGWPGPACGRSRWPST